MKPTVTKCFDCWTEDQRATPATWALGDEFFCDAHLRKANIDPAVAITIEAWRMAHNEPAHDEVVQARREQQAAAGRKNGKQVPALPLKEEKQERDMETKICSVDGCGKALRPSNTSGRCTKHWYQPKALRAKTNSKPARKAASKPQAPRAAATSQAVPQSAHIALTRDQLVSLFTSWPIERQAAAVQAVFVQELSQA